MPEAYVATMECALASTRRSAAKSSPERPAADPSPRRRRSCSRPAAPRRRDCLAGLHARRSFRARRRPRVRFLTATAARVRDTDPRTPSPCAPSSGSTCARCAPPAPCSPRERRSWSGASTTRCRWLPCTEKWTSLNPHDCGVRPIGPVTDAREDERIAVRSGGSPLHSRLRGEHGMGDPAARTPDCRRRARALASFPRCRSFDALPRIHSERVARLDSRLPRRRDRDVRGRPIRTTRVRRCAVRYPRGAARFALAAAATSTDTTPSSSSWERMRAVSRRCRPQMA